MIKFLAYFGLIDGRNITPTEQDNFGRNIFLGTVIIVFIIFVIETYLIFK